MTRPSLPQSKDRTESAEKSRPLRSLAPSAEGSSPILELQRAVGNQAVGFLFQRSLLQPRLRIGPSGDAYEREADRVADQIMRQGSEPQAPVSVAHAAASVQRQCHCQDDELVQRKCQCQEEEELVQPKAGSSPLHHPSGFETRVDALKGSGRPPPAAVRRFFEPRFGHDFAGVRVHTGTVASDATKAVGARAFTVGNDVVFGGGEWSPGTDAGKHLLAHELTHVVQQTPLIARRQPMLQRAAEDVSEAAPETEEGVANPESAAPAPETPTQQPGQDEPSSEASAAEEAPAAAVVVADDATEVGPGQMKKSEFLARLRPAVLAAAEGGLTDKSRTEQAGGVVDRWIGEYEGMDAGRINRDLSRLVPDDRPATAEEYISAVAERVRSGVAAWEATGELPDLEFPGLGALGGGLLGNFASVFFKARQGGARDPGDPRTLHARLGAGRPLEGGTRSRMESAFGRSFAHVRVHTDQQAAGLSNSLNAHAFTVGEHVAFGSKQYRPGTLAGDALLAHELAHVAQQDRTSESLQPMRTDGGGYSRLEHDADVAAVGAIAFLHNVRLPGLGVAQAARPRMTSGLRLQRCAGCQREASRPTAPPSTPPAPGQTAQSATQPAEQTAPVAEERQFCAAESDHPGIVALMAKAGAPAPVGRLAYGFTFWSKDVLTRPKVEIAWTKAGSAWTGAVKPTTAAMGRVEGLYLKDGDHEVPGKQVQANFPQCGTGGKRVPLFTHLSKDLSLLSRTAEQEHCDDYSRAFALTYEQWAGIINSVAGTTFGPGTKAQVKTLIDTELTKRGDKGAAFWVPELNRLKQLGVSERDGKRWHSFKSDAPPVTADAACTRLTAQTDKTSDTNIPGPSSTTLIK
jgi:hypothetical protein